MILTPGQIQHNFSPAVDHLAGRIVLITGAAGGIGAPLVRACARHGATVIMADRQVPAMEALYDELTAAELPEPVIYPVDLVGASPADLETMADAIGEQFETLDAVVHLAAEFRGLTQLEQLQPDRWQQELQGNLTAAHWVNQAVLALLKTSDQPRIVFTLDDEHRVSKAYWGAYGVSKLALHALASITASELESYGIKVNAVQPPPTDTPLRRKAYMAEDPSRLTAPEDLAPAYLYLLGAHDRLITGEVLRPHQ
ncbi:MAG: SDR family NAD(P)-dependent oxidoreductase [Xanthomonadales bacterium]|nr:SDR family NAD(P)-dependent oxidoreductase [Xanthomonadales bacterium]